MSGYFLYSGNKLEAFIPLLSSLINNDNIFNPNVAIVQNSYMTKWLKFKILENKSICSNIIFSNQENARKLILSQYKNSHDKFKTGAIPDNTSLQLLIYKVLSKTDFSGYSSAIAGYLKYSNPTLHNIKLSQFSGLLADLFINYSKTHPEMIFKWENDSFVTDENSPYRETERWQKFLWNEIFNQESLLTYNSEMLEILKTGEHFSNSEIKILVFGSIFLLENNIDLLYLAAKDIEVHHFMLTPSENFFGDVSRKKRTGNFEQEENINSLFRSFGSLSVTMQNKILDLDNIREIPMFNKHINDSLLHKIQNRIYDFVSSNRKESLMPDSSIKVISCPGKYREVEVLFDHIIDIFNTCPDIKQSDIAVLMPDVDEYKTIIQTVFMQKIISNGIGQTPVIHKTFMDINLSMNSIVIQGIILLFDILDSKFKSTDIYNLFRNQSFMDKFNLEFEDIELLNEFIQSLSIKWGFNASHKKDFDSRENFQNTWEEAFERLFLGHIFLGDELLNEKLPFIKYKSPQELDKLALIMDILSSLYKTHKDIKTKMSPGKWSDFAAGLITQYFDSGYDSQLKDDFNKITQLLEDIKKSSFFANDLTIDFLAFKSIFIEKINRLKITVFDKKQGGVNFASIRTLRAVPFKIIFMLGINEDSFPVIENKISFDLRHVIKKPLDASQKDVDRFTFLETILSAREKLFIFYNGKDEINNIELQPSILVKELFDYLNDSFDVHGFNTPEEAILEKHPLHGYSSKYFQNTSNLFSYNYYSYQSYLALTKESDIPGKNPDKAHQNGNRQIPESLNTKTTLQITNINIRDLETFITNPAKHFLQNKISLYFDDEEVIPEAEISFDLNYLEKWSFFRNIIPIIPVLDETGLQNYINRFINVKEAQSLITKGMFSDFEKENITYSLLILKHKLSNIDLGNFIPQIILSNEAGIKYVAPKSAMKSFQNFSLLRIPPLNINISGTIDTVFEKGFLIHTKNEFSLKNYLIPWLHYLILRSHPQTSDSFCSMNVYVYSLNKNELQNRNFCLTQDTALTILTQLIEFYIENNSKILPIHPKCIETLNKNDFSDKSKEQALIALEKIKEYCLYTKTCFTEKPDFSSANIQEYCNFFIKPLKDANE